MDEREVRQAMQVTRRRLLLTLTELCGRERELMAFLNALRDAHRFVSRRGDLEGEHSMLADRVESGREAVRHLQAAKRALANPKGG